MSSTCLKKAAFGRGWRHTQAVKSAKGKEIQQMASALINKEALYVWEHPGSTHTNKVAHTAQSIQEHPSTNKALSRLEG